MWIWFLMLALLLAPSMLLAQTGEAPPSASADATPARSLKTSCLLYTDRAYNTTSNLAQRSQCMGYFFGVSSTLLTLHAAGVKTNICLPQSVTTDQAIRSFIAWIRAHPEAENMPMTEAVFTSFREIFPCE